jgi:DUF1680 family protein
VLGGTEICCRTEMPFSGRVALTVKKAAAPVTLHLRIPAWCTSPVTVRGVTARPGTYLVLKNVSAGETVEFSLPFGFRSTRLTGAEEIPGKERYALAYGPLLLALMGRGDVSVRMNPARPEDWLIPLGKSVFRVKGNPGCEYRPYMEIGDEPFTVYPIAERP